jgi:putative transposase
MPRLIRPRATYAICRRIEGRRFLLRPDDELNRLFTWCLATAAAQFEVEVHVAVCMSTHYHLVVTVPNENVSELMHAMNLRMAQGLKVLRKYVSGVVWEPGKLSIVELKTTEAVVEQIAYALANPVKAGLVFDARDWPGVTAAVEDIGTGALSATRPDYYFDPEKWGDDVSHPLTLPACLRDRSIEEAHDWIRSELEHQQTLARAHVKAEGWKVLGAVAAKNVSPYRCAKSWREIGKLTPHIAAGRGQKEARLAAIAELLEFRALYRDAKRRWCAGERDVVFPAGTYWMRVHHGVRVAPFT